MAKRKYGKNMNKTQFEAAQTLPEPIRSEYIHCLQTEARHRRKMGAERPAQRISTGRSKYNEKYHISPNQLTLAL